MLRIKANLEEASISGSITDLQITRIAILSFLNSAEKSFIIKGIPSGDPSPYKWLLKDFVIERGAGPSRVSIPDQHSLLISGNPENLLKFAAWFDFPLDATANTHYHYDAVGGTPYVALDSIPLVIGITKSS